MTERQERKPQLRHGSREVTTTQSVEHKVLRYRVRSSYSEWRTKHLSAEYRAHIAERRRYVETFRHVRFFCRAYISNASNVAGLALFLGGPLDLDPAPMIRCITFPPHPALPPRPYPP